jgi:hypothetical protein
MIKRCQTCSSTIDSGIQCDECYKPNVLKIAKEIKDVMENHRATFKRLAESERLEKVEQLNQIGATVQVSFKSSMTLPTDSTERKQYPLMSGCLNYFPAALAGVSSISKLGNDKHNPGEPLHHARGKSMDHGDCILRHLMDLQDLLARDASSDLTIQKQILTEVSSLAWRALAYSQELHEKFGAPLAPGAKK